MVRRVWWWTQREPPLEKAEWKIQIYSILKWHEPINMEMICIFLAPQQPNVKMLFYSARDSESKRKFVVKCETTDNHGMMNEWWVFCALPWSLILIKWFLVSLYRNRDCRRRSFLAVPGIIEPESPMDMFYANDRLRTRFFPLGLVMRWLCVMRLINQCAEVGFRWKRVTSHHQPIQLQF